MTTETQSEARRKNAELSSGSSGVPGKAAASRNTSKRSFCSKDILVCGERGEDLEEFLGMILADVKPVGDLESELAHEMVACAWRLDRIRRARAEERWPTTG